MDERLKRLTHRETAELLEQMRAAARPGRHWRWARWEGEYGERAAAVEFPLGELMNPRIAGFVWAWAMLRCITTAPIQSGDHFNAQGIEGKIRVRTTLATALLVYADLPPHRCQVLVGPSPADTIPAGDISSLQGISSPQGIAGDRKLDDSQIQQDQETLRRLRRALIASLWHDVRHRSGRRSQRTRRLADRARALRARLADTETRLITYGGSR